MVPEEEYEALTAKVDQILSILSKEDRPVVSKLNGWLSEKETQELLGLKYGTLYNLRTNGDITFSKVGGKVFYNEKDVLKLIEKNKCSAVNN